MEDENLLLLADEALAVLHFVVIVVLLYLLFVLFVDPYVLED